MLNTELKLYYQIIFYTSSNYKTFIRTILIVNVKLYYYYNKKLLKNQIIVFRENLHLNFCVTCLLTNCWDCGIMEKRAGWVVGGTPKKLR